MSYMEHTNTSGEYNSSARAFFIGSALALTVGSAFGAEGPIQESEFPLTRRAICEFHHIPVVTKAQYQSCEAFVAERRSKLSDDEKRVAQEAACFGRHKTDHISYYNACIVALDGIYKTSFAAQSTQPGAVNPADKTTAVGSCAKGAAAGLGVSLLVHGAALVADFMGCAGACSVVASSWTLPAAGAVAVGCAGGVVDHALSSDSSPQYPKQQPR